MARKFGLSFAIMTVTLVALSLVGSHKVFAYTLCDVIGNASPKSSCTTAGAQAVPTFEGNLTSGMSSDTLTKHFESDLTAYLNEPHSSIDWIGANYIRGQLEQDGGNWKTNIEAATLKVVSLGNFPSSVYCDNTAYSPTQDAIVNDPGDCDTDQALAVYSGGKVVFLLRLACGNPIGHLSGPPPPNNPPTGSIDISCNSNGTAVLTYNYADSDAKNNNTAAYTRITNVSSGYRFANSYDGNTLSGNSAWNRQNYGASPTSQSGVNGDGSLEVWLYVEDDGPSAPNSANGYNYYQEDSPKVISCTQPNPTSICPGDPAIAANADVSVALPDLSPRNGTHGTSLPTVSSPNGSSSASGSTGSGAAYYIVSETATVPTAVTDYSAQTLGGSAVALQLGGGDKLNQATQTVGQTSVNYKPYTTAYPYDANQARVTYYSVYSQTRYTSSSSASYLCNSGDTLNSSTHKCTHTSSYTATAKNTCSGETINGDCYHGDGYWPNCRTAGDIEYTINGTRYCVKDSGVSAYSYSCPNGGTLSGTTCTTTSTYNATVYYVWQAGKTTTGLHSPSGTQNAAAMSACYSRNFTVTSVSVTASKNSSENPSSGSASATAHVHFSVSHGGNLRVPYSVDGLRYTVIFSGAGGLVCSGSGSGSFNVTTSSTAAGGYDTSPDAAVGSGSCSVSQPAPLGGQVCATFTVTPTGTHSDQNGTITSSNGMPIPGSSCSAPVINEPYLQVFGGDVAAGIGFLNSATSSCSSSSTASIQTFNTGTNPYGGSGTDLAALAVKPVATNYTDEGFASAQTYPGSLAVTGSLVTAPKTLSFGNSDSTSKYGGNYGTSTTNCSPDYASAAPTPTAANSLSGTQNLGSLASGAYVATGRISLLGTLSAGQHIVIYSASDVTVVGNITFGVPGATVADMPSFSLVVKGATINVDPSVTQLAGNYIAEGGTINDCATGGDIYAGCQAKLIVNGSFVANTIKFYRMGPGTQGSLRYSGSDRGPSLNNASEEFDYGPVNWLGQPPATGTPPTYDAVTSLPPVL